jgi:hypothetical protein
MRRLLPFVLVAVVATAAILAVSDRSDGGCPSGPEAKRVADSFVSALIRNDRSDAEEYVSGDAAALRADMPGASAKPGSTASVLRRAKRSTVKTCSVGLLAIVEAPPNDPCFSYDLETFGGGWLRSGGKMFPVNDFRVLMGCDGGEWRVTGTVRIE